MECLGFAVPACPVRLTDVLAMTDPGAAKVFGDPAPDRGPKRRVIFCGAGEKRFGFMRELFVMRNVFEAILEMWTRRGFLARGNG